MEILYLFSHSFCSLENDRRDIYDWNSFLWPHSVEQFWHVSFKTANTESHEATWKMLKCCWSQSSSSPKWMSIVFSKWISSHVLSGSVDVKGAKVRKSAFQKCLSEWTHKFPSWPECQKVELADQTEMFFILQYLKKKGVDRIKKLNPRSNGKTLFRKSPQNLFVWNCTLIMKNLFLFFYLL